MIKPCPNIEINNIETPCPIKKSLAKEFPELISRIGNTQNHTVNSKCHRNYRVTHQNRRKVPIHLQPKVKIELEKLLNEGHIEKSTNCSDQFFISPIVITVKRDQSIRIASDSNVSTFLMCRLYHSKKTLIRVVSFLTIEIAHN